MSSNQHDLRKILPKKFRSHGTYLGVRGGLARPLVMVGFPRQVILITYGMDYIAPQTETLVYFLLTTAASGHMWYVNKLTPSLTNSGNYQVTYIVRGPI